MEGNTHMQLIERDRIGYFNTYKYTFDAIEYLCFICVVSSVVLFIRLGAFHFGVFLLIDYTFIYRTHNNNFLSHSINTLFLSAGIDSYTSILDFT